MIKVISSNQYKEALDLIVAATRRSVSKTQCESISIDELDTCNSILIAIGPDELMGRKIIKWIKRKPRKLILLGSLPEALINFLQFEKIEWPNQIENWHNSPPSPLHNFSESKAIIQYQKKIEELNLNLWRRPMERFDFADEWNNMGYGAIRFDDSIWSLAMPLRAKSSTELAALLINDESFFSYASLSNNSNYSVLWFNRYVGPIDSFEWRIIEIFIAHYQFEKLPCYPVVKEIPFEFDAAITMRLDCDENVASAKPLFDKYKNMNIPFSLAIHTSAFNVERDRLIVNDVIKHKGSILSHSNTHAPQWGGCYENAKKDALESKELLESEVNIKVRYAVSPFHQTPLYALRALLDVGYDGCVGGIICNDPDFLMARGGCLHDIKDSFVGHSQQVMLHGDCILEGNQPLKIYQSSFDHAFETQTLFGYLDHPFSERYQYGWKDEASRIKIHEDFIRYIKTKAKNPIFLSEENALDFIKLKSNIFISQEKNRFYVNTSDFKADNKNYLSFAIEYKNKTLKAENELILE
jgi:hypothetical protein